MMESIIFVIIITIRMLRTLERRRERVIESVRERMNESREKKEGNGREESSSRTVKAYFALVQGM